MPARFSGKYALENKANMGCNLYISAIITDLISNQGHYLGIRASICKNICHQSVRDYWVQSVKFTRPMCNLDVLYIQ